MLAEGREDLLAELEKNLDPNTPTALVQAKTLSGLGGVGKTRLAIEIARDLQASYADGAVFVPLAPVSTPALIPAALASAIG